MTGWRWWLGVMFPFLVGCALPRTSPVRWTTEVPGLTRPEDSFTLRVLEVDEGGTPKSQGQWEALMAAAGQAEDVVLFVHGWRRDAGDVGTMEAFLKIYRGAFSCLAQRDVEGTEACRAIHGYCHPANPSTKLVVLLLWDGKSSPWGFRRIQQRAYGMGPGLQKILEAIHRSVHGRGTFLAMGHSLGGTALASALSASMKTGHPPVDGALLVVGAFDTGLFQRRSDSSNRPSEDPILLVNLFNRRDGYLRLYRWIYGGTTAGEAGLRAYPVTPGAPWVQEGKPCGAANATTFGGSLYAEAASLGPVGLQGLEILNMDVTGLMRGHAAIEDEATLRIYNRVAAEMLFQILWKRAPNE